MFDFDQRFRFLGNTYVLSNQTIQWFSADDNLAGPQCVLIDANKFGWISSDSQKKRQDQKVNADQIFLIFLQISNQRHHDTLIIELVACTKFWLFAFWVVVCYDTLVILFFSY